MSKQVVVAQKAPAPVGPYSPGVKVDKTVYLSGQIPLNASGELYGANIREQTELVLQNAGALLKAAGFDYSDVVKTTVFLVDLKEFAAMNEVYATFFAPPFPARSTIQVSALPRGAAVEIEMIAHKE